MSAKQVPEGVPSREEQLADLRKRLLGNKDFAKVRGLEQGLVPALIDLVDDAKSPTQFVKNWDEVSSTLRIVGEWLASYRRDGWDCAFLHLFRALKDNTYILPGETVPLDQTIPVTVVMFDPNDVLWLLDWIVTHPDNEGKLNVFRILREDLKPLVDSYVQIPEHMNRLFQLLPSLERKGESIVDAWKRDLLDSKIGTWRQNGFLEHQWDFLPPKEWSPETYCGGLRPPPGIFKNQFLTCLPLAFVFRGSQAETLAQFPRERQHQIASWQFDMPVALGDSGEYLIGFHPKDEQELWRREFPSLVSKGTSCDRGAVILCSEIHDIDFDAYPVITVQRVENKLMAPSNYRFVLKGTRIYTARRRKMRRRSLQQ
jgi:hypothetical protein